MRFYYCYIIIILITLFMVACVKDETCRENKDVTLNAAFFNKGTTNSMTIDSLTANGLGNDSFLYSASKSIKEVKLPLNNTAEQIIFEMEFNTIKDTVWVFYTNQEYFISYECGSVITHKIDTVTTTNHFISSIKILNHDIKTTDEQHLQIFH